LLLQLKSNIPQQLLKKTKNQNNFHPMDTLKPLPKTILI
jgi:hypothetical protein